MASHRVILLVNWMKFASAMLPELALRQSRFLINRKLLSLRTVFVKMVFGIGIVWVIQTYQMVARLIIVFLMMKVRLGNFGMVLAGLSRQT